MAVLLLLPVGVARAAANANESTMAREIADDINRERTARGLPTIPLDSTYFAGAQRVAESNRDRPCHACHSTDHPSGEIVWWGSDYPSSGSPIWWMGSPPHRALMLTPTATKLGVGVACNGTEHDAVAWIETQTEANNPSPTPVATKAGTGSRCKGGAASPPASSATTVAAVTSTSRRAGAAAATTSPPTTTAGSGRSTTTTSKPPRQAVAGELAVNADRSTDVAATPFAQAEAQAVAGRPIASSSRPLAGRNGVGGVGTALLLFTFSGALVVGRTSRRR